MLIIDCEKKQIKCKCKAKDFAKQIEILRNMGKAHSPLMEV